MRCASLLFAGGVDSGVGLWCFVIRFVALVLGMVCLSGMIGVVIMFGLMMCLF